MSSGTGRLALPVSILGLTYFGFKRYHAEFYKHLMAKNSYEFIYTTSAIENSVPYGNHSLLMLLCQIFKFFSNIICDTAPLMIINNFNSLLIALIAPLMLLFGHIQGQQPTGYLLAGYLFISSSYVSLLTPLLGPTGLHIILFLLALITFSKSSESKLFHLSHVAIQTLIFLNAPKMFFVTCLMLLYVLIKGSQDGKRNLYDVFQTIMVTSVTSLYTVYVGRYANPTQSIPHSDEVNNIFDTLKKDLVDYTQFNGKELMTNMLIPAFLNVTEHNIPIWFAVPATIGLLLYIIKPGRRFLVIAMILSFVNTIVFWDNDNPIKSMFYGPNFIIILLIGASFINQLESFVLEKINSKITILGRYKDHYTTVAPIILLAILSQQMNKLEPRENPTAAFAKLRTWDWHSYPKDSIFILDDMNYHQLKFLQASDPSFRTDLIPIPYTEMMKPIFKKRSRNYYPAKIPVGSYLNKDDGFTMDRFLVVNKGNNVFVDPSVDMKDVKSRRAHFWGAFWYYPFEQMTAFKVMEMISSSTKDYPHLHNQKFKAAALQNYHDGVFARIGTAAEQSIPPLDRQYETPEDGANAWFKAVEYNIYLKKCFVDTFADHPAYDGDELLAIPPYIFERIAKAALQSGNYLLRSGHKNYEYHQMSREYYQYYLKYAKYWEVPYHSKEAEEQVNRLIDQFTDILDPIIKEQKRKKVWKKDVDSLKDKKKTEKE